MKAIVYKDDLGQEWEVTDIPADLQDAAAQARTELIEAVAEYDDKLMEDYLEEKPIEADRLIEDIRKATLDISMTPVLCGSAFKNKGVQPLLDAVIDYLPSPLDVPSGRGPRPRRQTRSVRARPPTTSRSRRSPSRSWPTPTSASSPTSASTPASSRPAGACSTRSPAAPSASAAS